MRSRPLLSPRPPVSVSPARRLLSLADDGQHVRQVGEDLPAVFILDQELARQDLLPHDLALSLPRHDDGPDMLQMLWMLAISRAGGIPKIRTGPRNKGNKR